MDWRFKSTDQFNSLRKDLESLKPLSKNSRLLLISIRNISEIRLLKKVKVKGMFIMEGALS